MKEVWKPISGFEELYEVSSHGRVRSFDRYDYIGRLHKGRILVAGKSCGYLHVGLFKESKRTQKAIHRLVAETFLGMCPKGYEVNHIDENKTNNHINNLEYVTRKTNLTHGTRMARISEKLKKPIKRIDILTGEEKMYPSITDAAKDPEIGQGRDFSKKRSNIGKAVNSSNVSVAYGYRWERISKAWESEEQ